MFNSIQVTNYWFTQHRALRPLYQQAQTSSPNIWGISDQDVTLWTLLCNSCHRNKIQRDKRYNRVTQLDALNAPWESVTMNFITKLLTSKNPAWGVKFDSILTIVDRLTKYTMFIPFKETATASVLTYIILQELINSHRLSKKFITDRDKLFTSKFWEMLTAKLRINHKMLMTYHSQMNRQSKWMNQTVKTYLRHYVNRNQNNWVQLLLTAQFVYNKKIYELLFQTHLLNQLLNLMMSTLWTWSSHLNTLPEVERTTGHVLL